jgi:hypothetical protein
MSTSSPVRTRQSRRLSGLPQAGSKRPLRESLVNVVRSLLLVVGALSVIGTSNYFAYLIGRNHATYEELRRQVERIVKSVDQRRAEEELSLTTLKQRQDRLEQNASGLTDLTTSTINGKTTVVAPEPALVEKPIPAPADIATVTLPDPEVRVPPETSTNAVTKRRAVRGVAHQRVLRRPKIEKQAPTEALAQQPDPSTATRPTPDVGLAGQ